MNLFTKPRTLKYRLNLLLIFISLVPLVIIGILSYYSIYSILNNKIDKGIRQSEIRMKENIETVLFNLNYTSQRFALDSELIRLFDKDTPYDDVFRRFELIGELKRIYNLYNFTNPALGFMMVYFPGTDIQFPSISVRTDAAPERLPVLSAIDNVTFHGPHETQYDTNPRKLVFSVSRKLSLATNRPAYISIESNLSEASKLLVDNQFGYEAHHLLTDGNGKYIYDGLRKKTGHATTLPSFGNKDRIAHKGYYFYKETSVMGWSVLTAIPIAGFNREINQWMVLFTLGIVCTLILALMIGFAIWKMIYGPLIHLNRQIQSLADSNFHTEIEKTSIPEFDQVLNKFSWMRQRIWKLLLEVEHQEKEKRHLEVEKLVSQMNPHFLYNTLNTIQWLARQAGHDEIYKLVTLFYKLLRYNIGKNGTVVTMKEEVAALKDYVELQQIRYDYEFKVHIDMDQGLETVRIPRFVLQPLLENALYHGLEDGQGLIGVRIQTHNSDECLVEVWDNGRGMTADEIAVLLHSEEQEKQVGLGIGVKFVDRMLKVHMGTELRVESSQGKGTRFLFTLPLTRMSEEVKP
ncbi:hypothetical protein SY83_21420 [Paenibacillus swuensis]|uniref:histidine kinase n=1 Tax=Paenibacillus swuensis TaxID=1178515 RepID=A0A172TNT3_9BACL|nr:histidine kinase [Paenibacillus swuensis]ANE48413.1 hypothetical protein SY83_21420 [Paenibacillus swuensis]